jgi:predicted TIM-barrel fold metal-dependent hydrolase
MTRTDRGVPTPYFSGRDGAWFQSTLAIDLAKWAVTMMLQGGVFERFPALQVVILESMSGWIPSWLERMDEFYDVHPTPMQRLPSTYFETNISVSISPHERAAAGTLQLCGTDRVMWATDFPHPDSSLNTIPALEGLLAGCDEAGRQRVIGGTAQKLYKL